MKNPGTVRPFDIMLIKRPGQLQHQKLILQKNVLKDAAAIFLSFTLHSFHEFLAEVLLVFYLSNIAGALLTPSLIPLTSCTKFHLLNAIPIPLATNNGLTVKEIS